MKSISIALACLFILLPKSVLGGTDAFKTSEAELTELRALNKKSQGVKLPDRTLSERMVGRWTTGRHDYVFRKDGTWQMLPLEKGGMAGKWHVKNGQLFDEAKPGRVFLRVERDLLILKNEQGTYPFRYVRIK